MFRRRRAVQVIIADRIKLPAHPIVQRMRAGVQIQIRHRRSGATELKSLSVASMAISVVDTFPSATAMELLVCAAAGVSGLAGAFQHRLGGV
jgi:hypothetical protein